MMLHRILECKPTDEEDCFILLCDLTTANGERLTTHYVSRKNDPFGLGPTVRAALEMSEFEPGKFVPPTVQVEWVKTQAQKRINQVIPKWMIERVLTGGKDIPGDLKTKAQAIREASAKLEAMNPIPQDYYDDRWWP